MTARLTDKDTKICYVCGDENPLGLHVSFAPDGESRSRALYTVRPEHVGWPGLLHGGVLFTLMDEAVAWAVYYGGLRAVTAKAETRFRTPIPVGASLVITGSLVERARRLVRARAEVQRDDENHEKLAELVATLYLLDDAVPRPSFRE